MKSVENERRKYLFTVNPVENLKKAFFFRGIQKNDEGKYAVYNTYVQTPNPRNFVVDETFVYGLPFPLDMKCIMWKNKWTVHLNNPPFSDATYLFPVVKYLDSDDIQSILYASNLLQIDVRSIEESYVKQIHQCLNVMQLEPVPKRPKNTSSLTLTHPITPGVYQNVKCFDIDSMYPSIILQYKLFASYPPLHALLMHLIETKKNARKQRNVLLSKIAKLYANVLYGLLGVPSFFFYNSNLAYNIRKIGMQHMRKVRSKFEDQNMTVLGIQTDSIFLQGNLDDVECKKIVSQDIFEVKLENHFLQLYAFKSGYAGYTESRRIVENGTPGKIRAFTSVQKSLYRKFLQNVFDDNEENVLQTCIEYKQNIQVYGNLKRHFEAVLQFYDSDLLMFF